METQGKQKANWTDYFLFKCSKDNKHKAEYLLFVEERISKTKHEFLVSLKLAPPLVHTNT
jgi:hypothetical protein